MQIEANVRINKKTLQAALKNNNKAAAAVHLVYVSDREPGILRKRKEDSFYYTDGNKMVRGKEQLDRIRKLVIPPAWENVWICRQENGHLQVTGIDKLGRKQYRYHPSWNLLRNHTKFFRLLEFGKKLPQIRETLERHLALPGYPREKVLSAVVSLLQQTNIRIGNSFYEKLYGSFGLTTMKNRHVKVAGTTITFSFRGKKGVNHTIGLQSRKLANIVKACRDIPGKELFEYIDAEGIIHKIDSGMVNEYIRTIAESDFSAKDFRTWAGSVEALVGFRELNRYETTAEMNRNTVAVLDRVAQQLGNTRTVCKKYYVHPAIVQLYEAGKLEDFFVSGVKMPHTDGLTAEEQILMRILEHG